MRLEEQVRNEGILTGGGPDAVSFPVRLSSAPGRLEIEAWISNFGSSNVHLVSGDYTLAQCQAMLERGFNDFIMTLTAAGPVRRGLPGDPGRVTVFFEAVNSSGQTQVCTIIIRKYRE